MDVPKKRRSITVRDKLKIIADFKSSGLSARAFALTRNINESMLRRWMEKEGDFRAIPKTQIRTIRKIPRKRIGYWPEIDEKLLKWIQERNNKGLRVKDKFIQMAARNIRDEIVATLDDGEYKDWLVSFKASKIFVHRFKQRFNLRSRRHTTTHTLPMRFREQAVEFIASVHSKINEFNIPRERIINMDQVPRYYENDMSTTIAEKGRKEVPLRKSSTSHKKFTFTPFITASGKFLMKHALFSNLKNIPKNYDERCKVAVNSTAMWNADILKTTIGMVAKKCRGIFDTKADVLFIFDSYGVHKKFVTDYAYQYAQRGIHFAVIPPNLTGLLQPLDVCINRSFQQFFDDCTDAYQSESLANDTNKTVKGNVKMPSADLVTKWASDWADTKTEAEIRKAFDVCGLVPPNEFAVNKLHAPLQEIYSHNFDTATWLNKYSSIVGSSALVFNEQHHIYEGRFAFFKALFATMSDGSTLDFNVWRKSALEEIDEFLRNDPFASPIYRRADKEVLDDGWTFTTGFFEFYAAAHISNTNIHVITLNDDDEPLKRTIFEVENATVTIAFFLKTKESKIIHDEGYDPNRLHFIGEIVEENDSDQGADENEDTDNADDDGYSGSFTDEMNLRGEEMVEEEFVEEHDEELVIERVEEHDEELVIERVEEHDEELVIERVEEETVEEHDKEYIEEMVEEELAVEHFVEEDYIDVG